MVERIPTDSETAGSSGWLTLGRNEGCADGTAVSVGTCEGWLDG